MKASAVYRKAAELIFTGEATRSCWAVDAAQNGQGGFGGKHCELTKVYIDTILGTAWTAELFLHESQEQADKVRVLALLLMSEIAKDEERKRGN